MQRLCCPSSTPGPRPPGPVSERPGAAAVPADDLRDHRLGRGRDRRLLVLGQPAEDAARGGCRCARRRRSTCPATSERRAMPARRRRRRRENGYTDGVGGVAVTAVQDPENKRRLSVTVAGPVADVLRPRVRHEPDAGIAARPSAEFTLPVPMGSPQNYYGVGDFMKNTITTATPQRTGWDASPVSPARSGRPPRTPTAPSTRASLCLRAPRRRRVQSSSSTSPTRCPGWPRIRPCPSRAWRSTCGRA